MLADGGPTEMPAINFGSRNLACKILSQGLSRSVSAFSIFMREYLDPVVEADKFAQYLDKKWIAVNKTAVIKCIHQSGFKLTIKKGHFGLRQFEIIGRTISQE